MHADAALSEKIRVLAYPDSTLKGRANLLVMPNLDTGNITYNMLKMTGSNGVAMGPILLGAARPVHILTTSATVRRIVNMTALAVVDAQRKPPRPPAAARPARGTAGRAPQRGALFARTVWPGTPARRPPRATRRMPTDGRCHAGALVPSAPRC